MSVFIWIIKVKRAILSFENHKNNQKEDNYRHVHLLFKKKSNKLQCPHLPYINSTMLDRLIKLLFLILEFWSEKRR